MKIMVNGHQLAKPRNWQLPTKLQNAPRTAIPIDATAAVGDNDFFSLGIKLPTDCDMELWAGIVVAVAARRVSVGEVCKSIESTYVPRMSHHPHVASTKRAAVESSTIAVQLTCPMGLQTLVVPCRGKRCEHEQPFELANFINQCCQTHVWICPICQVSLYPNEIVIDFALVAFLSENKHRMDELAGAIVTESGTIVPRLRPKKTVVEATVIDDED
jgi:hypothetical protein